VEILSKIKANLERPEHPEAASSITRKTRALSQAVNKEKAKLLGRGGGKIKIMLTCGPSCDTWTTQMRTRKS
jgi:hypothetical protein